jgi:hypothetical protein
LEFKVQEEGKPEEGASQLGTPPIPAKTEMGTVVRFAACAIMGMRTGYTVFITVWFAPMLPCCIRGGGMAT